MAHIIAAEQKLHNNSLIVHGRHAKRSFPDSLGHVLNMFWSLFSTNKTAKVNFSFLFYNRLKGGKESRLCATHSWKYIFGQGLLNYPAGTWIMIESHLNRYLKWEKFITCQKKIGAEAKLMEIVHSGTVLSNAAPGQCCWDCVNHFSNRQKLKIESLRIVQENLWLQGKPPRN